jgi:hypothetical protein
MSKIPPFYLTQPQLNLTLTLMASPLYYTSPRQTTFPSRIDLLRFKLIPTNGSISKLPTLFVTNSFH